MNNVLHIRSSFDSGGTEILLLNLYNYNQDYFKIHLVLIKDGNLIQYLSNPKNHYYKFFRKRFLDFSVIKKLRQVITNNSITIIHTHQEIELIYAIILKLFIPEIKIFHSVHLINNGKNWQFYLERFLVNFTQKIIAVSQTVKSYLISRGYASNKIIVLYNPVYIPNKVNSEELENFKKKINYNSSDFIVMMIGNFRKEKDQLTLVKAFNLLRNVYPQLKLIFIGKNNEFSNKCKEITLKEDINKRVFYMGALNNASNYIQCCDLFVYSSKSETFGIAIIEALLQYKPVLASNIDAFIELSNNGEYFELFEVGNEKDLSNKIRNYIINGIEEKILKKAYQYAVSNFNLENFIKNLYTIYFQ